MTEPQPQPGMVPKFGSFRPKIIAPASPNQVDKNRGYKPKTKHEHNTLRTERKPHDRHDQSRGEKTSHKRHRPSPDVVQHTRNEPPDQIFITDRKGDVNNLIY